MQFNIHRDDDFITIYDIGLEGRKKLISRLSGPDSGPKSQFTYSNWEKKIISSSTNKMMVEFKSDDIIEYTGFSLSIKFTPLENKLCESCLDMVQKTLKSPNHPNSYGNNISCYWLITAQNGFHITLKFQEFDVKYSVLIENILLNYTMLAPKTTGNVFLKLIQKPLL